MEVTIKEAIENILQKEWLIPDFQRDFVWDKNRITNLWDSIMRGYPIASLLLWKINSAYEQDYKLCGFYPFMADQNLSNQKYPDLQSDLTSKFNAVLDGQQRLTSLLIGLNGSISEKKYNKEKISHLYLCLSDNKKEAEDAFTKKYDFDFKFISDDSTNVSEIYKDNVDKIWFKVSKIMDFKESADVNTYCNKHNIGGDGLNIIANLRGKVYGADYKLSYDIQDNQTDAINMFLRVNTGVKPLTMADIILSTITTRWGDVKKSIKDLIADINGKGFKVSTDFIVKCLLCIYGTSVKYQPTSINEDFVNNVRDNWGNINETMITLFNMLVGFGFANKKFAFNVLTPVFCYLFWNEKYKISDIDNADKVTIHHWLLKTIILESFSKAADTAIANAIQPFEDRNKKHSSFPEGETSKKLGQKPLSDDEINSLLGDLLFRDSKTYFVLSMIHLNHNNFDFSQPHDIDHLHPKDNIEKGKLKSEQCNSIINLQLLEEKNNRKEKNSLPLKDWIKEDPKRVSDSFIPAGISLAVKDFDKFYEERKKLMVSELLRKLE